ncbi:helix-turn-helix transcriptional regulator [Pseudomonas kuykendallii]|nr:AlpA family phage regulatory protein [Pseudomonas kuykendallii]
MREEEVCAATSLSRATLWREVKAERFPKPIKLTPGRVGWRSSHVAAWQDSPTTWKP